jgi:hypothetical protein
MCPNCGMMHYQPAEPWRERAAIAAKCPFNPVHGGCCYPDCTPDCPGRQQTPVSDAEVEAAALALQKLAGEPKDDLDLCGLKAWGYWADARAALEAAAAVRRKG